MTLSSRLLYRSLSISNNNNNNTHRNLLLFLNTSTNASSPQISRRHFHSCYNGKNFSIVRSCDGSSRGMKRGIMGQNWSVRCHSHMDFDENAERITVHIVDLKKEGGKKYTVQARIGASVLETTREFDIDLEGACEASLACSTCHCYIPMEYHEFLPEPEEEEEDMLDMAYGLEEESRLGCQIRFTKEMEGVTITLPKATRNYYVDKA